MTDFVYFVLASMSKFLARTCASFCFIFVGSTSNLSSRSRVALGSSLFGFRSNKPVFHHNRGSRLQARSQLVLSECDAREKENGRKKFPGSGAREKRNWTLDTASREEKSVWQSQRNRSEYRNREREKKLDANYSRVRKLYVRS